MLLKNSYYEFVKSHLRETAIYGKEQCENASVVVVSRAFRKTRIIGSEVFDRR